MSFASYSLTDLIFPLIYLNLIHTFEGLLET